MKFSVFLPTGFAREFTRIPDPVQAYDTLTDIALAAEAAGYETLWAPDHLTTIPPSHDMDNIWRTATTLVIIRATDEAARALVPPGIDFAFPGDVGVYGLVGTIDTIKERVAAYVEAGVQELALGFEDPTSVDQIRQFAELFIATPSSRSVKPNGTATVSTASGWELAPYSWR